jgi:hypothetical protein
MTRAKCQSQEKNENELDTSAIQTPDRNPEKNSKSLKIEKKLTATVESLTRMIVNAIIWLM